MSSIIQKAQASKGLQNTKHVTMEINVLQPNGSYYPMTSGQILEFEAPQVTKPTLIRKISSVPFINGGVYAGYTHPFAFFYALKCHISVASRELAEFLISDVCEVSGVAFNSITNAISLGLRSKELNLLNLIPVLPNEKIKLRVVAPTILAPIPGAASLYIHSFLLIGTQEV